MADVFLSYAREDNARAEQIARTLEAAGLDVFWDNEIPPGTTWADYIESKLTQCKALIVLWSETSTKSQWVREEARLGRDKGVLIPVMIDACQPPFGFGELQAANLSAWQGDANDPTWRRFVEAVGSFASAQPRPAVARPQTPAPALAQARAWMQAKGVSAWALVAGAVGAAIVVIVAVGAILPAQQQSQARQAANLNPGPADASPSQPVSSAQNPYEQQILGRLGQAENAFSAQGFQQLAQPMSGQLPQGQYQNIPVTLTAGAEYRIIGVCDDDCGDLDLFLYDQNNNVVSQDNAVDATPIVSAVPQWNGPFTVQAVMHNCRISPCYYALAVYGRAPQAQ